MNNYFYLNQNNEQKGPFPSQEIVKYITLDTLVYGPGMTQWAKASDVPEIAAYFNYGAQPAPQQVQYGQEPAKKSSKALIYVLVAVVVLLAGAVTFLLLNKNGSSSTETSSTSAKVESSALTDADDFDIDEDEDDATAEAASDEDLPPSKIMIKDANDHGVVLRRTPNDNSKISGNSAAHFFSGDVLVCAGISGDYYKVEYHGDYYFIPRQYATPYEGSQEPSEGVYNTQPVVQRTVPNRIRIKDANNAGVVLRSFPNESSKMTGPSNPHFYTGGVLDCVGIEGNYYAVSYNYGVYYIPMRYADPY